METQKVISYWKMVAAGVGIACIAGAFFASGIINGIAGVTFGLIAILAGFALAMYE